MPGWLEHLATPEILFPTAIILLILYLMIRAAIKLFPVLSKLVKLINTLFGDEEKPGVALRMNMIVESIAELSKDTKGQGVILERVRAQVENDHDTNFRDDQDKVMKTVEDLAEEFKEHVAISKVKDNEAAETSYKVAVLAENLSKITPVVEHLGATWGNKSRNN